MLNVINLCLVDLHQYLKHKNVEIYPINLAKSPHFCGEIYLTTIPSSNFSKNLTYLWYGSLFIILNFTTYLNTFLCSFKF